MRSDAKGTGQLTRLFARVIVLERGGRKLALVSEDLNGVAGGTLLDAANRDADIGFSEQNVLDSASHTHAAEGGYFNFSTYNTVAPAPNSPTQLSVAFDPRLYGFLVEASPWPSAATTPTSVPPNWDGVTPSCWA